MNKPLLSIVIANYNYGRFLEESLCSVLRQCVEWASIEKGVPVNSLTLSCGANLEVIICDAGSTDESVAIIEKYAKLLGGIRFSEKSLPTDESSFYWCSEKDRGQSHAFNKGFQLAHGRLGCWLNADDVFMPNSLDVVARYAMKRPNAKWITGGCVWLNADGSVKRCTPNANFPVFLYRYLPHYIVGGPSTFFDLTMFREEGMFDEQLYYSMDSDLWMRFMVKKVKLHSVGVYVWTFRLHEESKTASIVLEGTVSDKRKNEGKRISSRYLGFASAKTCQRVYSMIKILKGCYIRSIFDTMRFKNHQVDDIQ